MGGLEIWYLIDQFVWKRISAGDYRVIKVFYDNQGECLVLDTG